MAQVLIVAKGIKKTAVSFKPDQNRTKWRKHSLSHDQRSSKITQSWPYHVKLAWFVPLDCKSTKVAYGAAPVSRQKSPTVLLGLMWSDAVGDPWG